MNTYTTTLYKSRVVRFINLLCTKLIYSSSNNSQIYTLNTVAELVLLKISIHIIIYL